MHTWLEKSDAGHAEVKNKAHALSRHARTLLVIIDGRRPAAEWAQLIKGASDGDLQQLLDAGLLVPAAAPAPRASRRSSEAEAPMGEMLKSLNYDQLYTLLTASAKEHLGLLKGFTFVLEVEKADGVDGLRKLAEQLVAQVREKKGDTAAREVRLALVGA